jgi:hypothetical protein
MLICEWSDWLVTLDTDDSSEQHRSVAFHGLNFYVRSLRSNILNNSDFGSG